MQLSFPTSLQKGLQITAALTAAALIGLTPSGASAKMPNIKRQSDVTISFALTPTAAAPVGASGTAEIKVSQKKKASESATTLEVNVNGLLPGDYLVEASALDATTPVISETITIPEPVVPPAGTEPTEVEDTAELEITLPSSVDVRSISTLTVSAETIDTTTTPATVVKTVLLEGAANTSTASLKFFANVRVTAPPASALTNTPSATDDTTTEVEAGKGNGKGNGKNKDKNKNKNNGNGNGNGNGKDKAPKGPKTKKVHGHALAKISVTDNSTTKRFFQFIGFGAPANATLNIVVNGEVAGTVTSTKQGHVKFRETALSETVDLSDLDLVTITTAEGLAVMQADF